MPLDLLDFLNAAGQGFAGYQEAKDFVDQRERAQAMEDEDREEEKRVRALEKALLSLELEQRAEGPQERYSVQDGQVVPQGGFTDRGAAEQAAEAARARARRTDLSDRNRQVLHAERVAEARARGTAAGTPPRPEGAGARPTEAQMRFGLGLARAEPAFQQIEQLMELFGGRVPETSLFRVVPGLGQYATPADVQAYNQAAEAIASAILRAESGAAISAEEAKSYARQFLPTPGDRPEVIRQKLEATRATLQRMRDLSGGAAGMQSPPSGPPSAPGTVQTDGPVNFYEKYPYLRPPGG